MAKGEKHGLPAMPLYTRDLLGSDAAAVMTNEQLGIYTKLLARAWNAEPPPHLPADEAVLASYAGVPLARWRKIRDPIMQRFPALHDGTLGNVKQRAVYEEVTEFEGTKTTRAKKAAAARWGKKEPTTSEGD